MTASLLISDHHDIKVNESTLSGNLKLAEFFQKKAPALSHLINELLIKQVLNKSSYPQARRSPIPVEKDPRRQQHPRWYNGILRAGPKATTRVDKRSGIIEIYRLCVKSFLQKVPG
jgi:hypothetical protein